MEVIKLKKHFINRWDKDSIRPGPVGSVGDVNLQVKLRKSANYLPNRYDETFSKENEKWSGANISDGQWYGFTSGGRGAVTIRENWTNDPAFKTDIGYRFENIVPVDKSRIVKTVPLGNYDWDAQRARIYNAKVTGDAFLPLPMGYSKPENLLPRGSHFPRVLAESNGEGTALPAADVKITNPLFGDTGKIELPAITDCNENDMKAIFTLEKNDPRRKLAVPADYPYREVEVIFGKPHVHNLWPSPESTIAFNTKTKEVEDFLQFSPCGTKYVPSGYASRAPKVIRPPIAIPKPGNQDKRREEEKNKKQKMR